MSNLELIDWRLVGFSALWLVGLGVILATLSHADYDAARQQVRLSAALQQSGFQVLLNVGQVLFCLGLLGTAGSLWERLAWAGLGLWFASQAWRAGRRLPAQRRPPQE
jgi:hypothetical protein